MVHALERAHHYLRPDGYLIDVHPTPEQARLEIGFGTDVVDLSIVDDIDESRGPRTRHARADAALAEAVARGWFVVEEHEEFQFRRYADGVAEMQDHFRTWKGAVIDGRAWARAAELQRAHPDSWLCLREQVGIARLRPSAAAVRSAGL
jgi:hypothetical protein